MRTRGGRAAVAGALVLALAAPLANAGACPDPDEEPLVLLYADTLTLGVRPSRASYRPGDTATVRFTVHRHLPAGVPSEPIAADVKATLRARNGVEPARFAFRLPASGTTTKTWRIPKGTRPGPLEIEATALYELLPSPSCYSSLAYERGYARVQKFLTIAR